jgi:hypothetical protein
VGRLRRTVMRKLPLGLKIVLLTDATVGLVLFFISGYSIYNIILGLQRGADLDLFQVLLVSLYCWWFVVFLLTAKNILKFKASAFVWQTWANVLAVIVSLLLYGYGYWLTRGSTISYSPLQKYFTLAAIVLLVFVVWNYFYLRRLKVREQF